jgi:hypothetical protein
MKAKKNTHTIRLSEEGEARLQKAYGEVGELYDWDLDVFIRVLLCRGLNGHITQREIDDCLAYAANGTGTLPEIRRDTGMPKVIPFPCNQRKMIKL